MLFSNEEVAKFINENLVSAWESIRPVAQVDIDFGNGHKLHRTLNGNIVTYLCTPEGKVFDILPGLYSADGYLQALRRSLEVYYTRHQEQADEDSLEEALAKYHAESLKTSGAPIGIVRRLTMSDAIGKGFVENPIKEVIGGPDIKAPLDVSKRRVEQPVKSVMAPVTKDVLLALDTRINEQLRQEKVHAYLNRVPLPEPKDIYRSIYKDVLHVDVEDPYLGLAPLVFGGAEGRTD